MHLRGRASRCSLVLVLAVKIGATDEISQRHPQGRGRHERASRLAEDERTNKPASWPAAIIPAATTAGNVQAVGAPVEAGGIYGDLEAALALVEKDGYDPTGIASRRDMRSMLRRARSANGDLLGEVSTSQAWDLPVSYVNAGTFTGNALAVVGDFNNAILAVRQDLTYKLLDQAVITDDTGAAVYNLPQQDMLALRVVARFAFAIANPVTRPDTGAGTPFPFAVLNTA